MHVNAVLKCKVRSSTVFLHVQLRMNPYAFLSFIAGDEGAERSKCWARTEHLRDSSAQWGQRARGVCGRRGRRGRGIFVRARGGDRARTCGQRERGRIQPPHGVLVSAAPHSCRLHPQQPRIVAVVSETHSGTHRTEWNSEVTTQIVLMMLCNQLVFHFSPCHSADQALLDNTFTPSS